MKVYSQNIGKILAKININEHILPIFLIKFINILAKTIKYKKSLNINFSKTAYMSDFAWELSLFFPYLLYTFG